MRMTHSVLVSDRNISVDTPGYTITGFPSEQAAHLFLSLGLAVPLQRRIRSINTLKSRSR